jgi:hypothetical protein
MVPLATEVRNGFQAFLSKKDFTGETPRKPTENEDHSLWVA